MTTTWRLPEWLGGHEVQVYAISENGLAATIDIVGHEGASPDSPTVRVPREWLIEVRPPSIDDPVTLPVRVPDVVRRGDISVWESSRSGAAVRLGMAGDDGGRSRVRDLTPESARTLARALWQRANEVEAQP